MSIKKIIFIFISVVISQQVDAQPRNIIKLTPIVFDNMVSALDYGALDLYSIRNKFGLAIKYERLVGRRISIGLWVQKYYNTQNEIYTTSDGYSPKDFRNLEISQCTYKHSGMLLGYESIYYFEDFDNEGPNSGYIGLSAQYGSFTQGMPSAHYLGPNSKTELKSFNDQSVNVNRLGVKLGHSYTSIVSFDMYCTLSYNFTTGPINQNFVAPTQIRPISFGFGFLLGVPF